MTTEKLMHKNNRKISDEDLIDFVKELEDVYDSYLREKEDKAVRDLLLLNEIYNSMVEIKRVLRVRKVEVQEL
ncbi:MAG: hypothetical protein ACUVXA_13120 [Candidatus Jordarchaeum sp.]|uniref:hypothetical protein n=1 Tax=Candidatus Jordarchaeum sp. TaxID=2823881 RepID=UPI00404B6112